MLTHDIKQAKILEKFHITDEPTERFYANLFPICLSPCNDYCRPVEMFSLETYGFQGSVEFLHVGRLSIFMNEVLY